MSALVLGAAVLVLGAGSRTATADDRIVVETYDGARPPDAGPVLAKLHAELARRGFEEGDALDADITARLSRPGGALGAGQVVDAQRAVDLAYQRFIDGDYPAAITAASNALQTYATAPGQLTHEPALRSLRFKALLIAARSSEAIDKGEDAFAFMAEAVRSFPDHPVSGSEFDPRVRALQRKVKDELTKQGAGAIEIKVDDPAAVIFVDEQFVGTGAAKTAALPGRYRVYVSKSDQPGRVREVDVAPGRTTSVSVSWQVDGALRSGPGFVALETAKDAAPDATTAAAELLGRALGARRVVVLSLRPIEGRRSIIAYAITIESQTRVFGAVQIDPVAPAPDTIARLAALVAGDKDVSPTGLITVEPVWAPPPHAAHRLGVQRKAAIAVGGVAIATGVAALAFELSSRSTYAESKTEEDNARQDALYDSANHKYKIAQGLGLGAAACAIAGLTLWLTGDLSDERPTLVLAPTPDGGSFFVQGSF